MIVDDLGLDKWADLWDTVYKNGYAEPGSGYRHVKGVEKDLDFRFDLYLTPHWHALCKTDLVLEIGCGNGGYASGVFKKVGMYVGIDISGYAIDMARKDYKGEKHVWFEKTSEISELRQKFDLIFSTAVFHHIPRFYTKKYIIDSYKALKPGGAVFFQFLSGTVNTNPVKFSDIMADSGVVRLTPQVGHSEEDIQAMFSEAGFKKVWFYKSVVEGTDKYHGLFVVGRV